MKIETDNPKAPEPEAEAPAPAKARAVRRRRVIYVHGFDPAPSERYRRLLARAGADRDGPPPTMTPVAPLSDVSEGWRVSARRQGGGSVQTVFEILRYEDVVRQWRERPVARRLWSGLSAMARYIRRGGLRRTFAFAVGPGLLFFYPVVMLLGFLLGGLVLGRYAGEAAEIWLGAPDWASQAGRVVGAVFGFWLSLLLERRFFAHLMLSLFDFLIRIAADEPPAGRLEMRVGAFADRIAAAVEAAEDARVDEIVIVGHSLGGLVAVRALAAALERDADLTGGRAKLSLLTLGSVAGYTACAGGPGADAYAADVARVAMEEDLTWVDVSSPRDSFSFGLVDPLLMIDAPPAEARSPKVISAKFGRFRPDPQDRRTRFRAMGMHMKYLGAPDRAGAFDFFAVVSGPQTLQARFAERRNSPRARMLVR